MPVNYVPHDKQIAAHSAFLIEGFKRGVLLMGRQCLAPDTLIRTSMGLKPVSQIEVGDLVLSHNGNSWEYKPVINTWEYGVDVDPKPMLTLQVYGQTITCTYDHPFYSNGAYIPVYQLAWGSLAASQREKLQLLCKQYGQDFDDQASWWPQNGSNETSTGRERLSTDGFRRKDREGASGSGADLAAQPQQSPGGKSQKWRKDQQPADQLGVGDSSGEYPAQSQQRVGSRQTGGELRLPYPGERAGVGDSPRQASTSDDCRPVRGVLVHNPRYTTAPELEAPVAVSECQPTHAIDVADNHNYAITEAEILVANSGKTYFATNHSWLSAVIQQGRYGIVFKTYKQAHEVVWRQYIPLIPKELIYKTNEQDLIVELNYVKGPVTLPDGTTILVEHDQNKPRSTIQLLGSDQADSHRGFKMDGLIFDEYADQDPNNWDSVYKHFFTTTNGWAIFMGTPRGYNHFYDLIQFAQSDERWFYQEATWRDSPYVSREFIEEERAEAEKTGKLSTFLQEVELEFRAVQGAVYPQFDRKIHVVKPTDIPDDLTIYVGIDFGYHTTAVIFVGIDKDQNWWVFDELYGRETTLQELLPLIRLKLADKRLVLMVGDSAATDAIETMAKEFPIVPVVKHQDSIIHGIDLIRTKLRPRIQLTGLPKPTLLISSVCKNFIYEMESYRYPEDKPDRNPLEVPMKVDDHGPDAARYLALHLKYGLQKDDKLPKSSLVKSLNEYGL